MSLQDSLREHANDGSNLLTTTISKSFLKRIANELDRLQATLTQIDDCRAERDALRRQVAAMRDALLIGRENTELYVTDSDYPPSGRAIAASELKEIDAALANTEAAALAHDKEVRNRALEEAAVKLLADAEAYRARGVNPGHLEQVDAVMGAARALSNAANSILAMKETT